MAKAKAVVSPRRNLSTFKASHDPAVIVPNKIRAGLEKLRALAGDEGYAYESTNPPDADNSVPPFIKLADVSAAHLSQYRSQFAGHIVEVRQDYGTKRNPRKVWFATEKAAKAARE